MIPQLGQSNFLQGQQIGSGIANSFLQPYYQAQQNSRANQELQNQMQFHQDQLRQMAIQNQLAQQEFQQRMNQFQTGLATTPGVSAPGTLPGPYSDIRPLPGSGGMNFSPQAAFNQKLSQTGQEATQAGNIQTQQQLTADALKSSQDADFQNRLLGAIPSQSYSQLQTESGAAPLDKSGQSLGPNMANFSKIPLTNTAIDIPKRQEALAAQYGITHPHITKVVGPDGKVSVINMQPGQQLPDGFSIFNPSQAPDSVVKTHGQLLIDGKETPSMISMRGNERGLAIQEANRISMATTGKMYDAAGANVDYSQASNAGVQGQLKMIQTLTSGGPDGKGTLGQFKKLSDGITRTEFPGLNDVAGWARLEAGDPAMAAFHAAAVEVASQVSGVFGGTNSPTDNKLGEAKGVLNTGFTKEQVNAIEGTLRPLMQARADGLIGNNKILQGQFRNNQQNQAAPHQTPGTILKQNGVTYRVDQNGTPQPVQ